MVPRTKMKTTMDTWVRQILAPPKEELLIRSN